MMGLRWWGWLLFVFIMAHVMRVDDNVYFIVAGLAMTYLFVRGIDSVIGSWRASPE